MAKKQSTRLVLPLVVLLVLIGLILLLIDPLGWRTPDEETIKAQDPTRFTLCDAQKDDITAIEIVKPLDEPFSLVKESDNWFVERNGNRYRAEMMRVDNMLQDLPGLETDSLATDKVDQHGNYEVDNNQGIRLTIYTGENVACDLVVGKAAPGYKSAFVRKPDEDKVYRASKNVKSLVGFAYTSFRSKTPWPFDSTGATTVSIAAPGGDETASFTRAAGGFWENIDGGNGNQNAINELLNTFSKLRIADYVDDIGDLDTGLTEDGTLNLVVTAADGEYTLQLGKHEEEKNQYYVMDQDGHVALVSEANIKFLLEADIANLKMEQLPEEPEMAIGEGAAPIVGDTPMEAGE